MSLKNSKNTWVTEMFCKGQKTRGIQLNVLNCDIDVSESKLQSHFYANLSSARGVMVIVVGNGHGDTISNPGRD